MAKKLTREAANDLLLGLRDSIASLKSCLPGEVPNEARILRKSMAEVETMQLVRHSKMIEDRRHNLVKEAERVLMSRSA